MANNNDKDFLTQLLNELDLSHDSLDLYLKIIGRPPLTMEEISSITETTNEELNKSLIEELLTKGLCISNSESSEEITPYYYAIPPYRAFLNYYEKFDVKSNQMANELPDKISKIFNEIKEESGFLLNLKNYIKNFQEAKTTIVANLSLIKADYEDGVSLIPELNLLLNNTSKFYKMVENVFNLHFQNFVKQIENTKQEIMENLEEFNLKKKQKDIKLLVDKIIDNKINEIKESFNEKLPDVFKKNSEILQQNINEISSQVGKIENEIRMSLFDLMYEYEQTISDQEKTFNMVLEKEEEKFSIFDESLSQKIFELLANVFNFMSSPIHQNNQAFQFLFEKTKQMPIKIIKKSEEIKIPPPSGEIAEKKEPIGKEIDTISTFIEEKEKIIEVIEEKKEKAPLKSIKDEILKSGVLKGELTEIGSRFIAISEELDSKNGNVIAKHLEELNDYILENKGFSVILNDIRRWITDVKNKGKLDEDVQKVLKNRIKNWIERLAN